MTIRELHRDTWLPRPLEEVFAFFASAANLERITPPWLRFEIATPTPVAMHEGAQIDYRLVVHGIPLRWQSEITVWQPPHRFVDEQRRGPYRTWVHEHRFARDGEGTRLTDHVRYSLRGGRLLGGLIDRLLVARDVRRIFAYRALRLHELLGAPAATPSRQLEDLKVTA